MIGPRNLHPDELGDAEGMDLQDALRMANRLTESMGDLPAHADLDFADQVMAALAGEPTPGTTGFLLPLRRRGLLRGFRESFRQAWASVGGGRPMLGRSAALAYVLAAMMAGVSLTGVVTLGAAGALGLLNATPSESPTPSPAPTEAPPSIAPLPSPNAVEPSEGPTPTPSETPDESEGPDDNGGNSGPGGGNSGPGGGDDESGSGDDESGSGDDGERSGGGGSGSDDSGSDSEED